ncbi:MAG: hypothetical protein K2O23_01290 [Anaeroplasmataceae bacterium]|nr:hypothetical protein [Anaeroplasmataceae bacterium]
MNILDVLLDEENKDPIVLSNEKGTFYKFEQICVIPYNDKIYCILKPIDKMKGVEEDEALVFYVDEEEETPSLKVETNELTSLKIFEEYYDLLEKSWKEKKE